jgi:hypothetical protein
VIDEEAPPSKSGFSLHSRWTIMTTSRTKKSLLVVYYYNGNKQNEILHHDATWEEEADTNPSHA